MKRVLFIGFLLLALTSNANPEILNVDSNPLELTIIEPTEEWQVYDTYDGVKVEYRMTRCGDGVELREQNLMLFRFTNTSSDVKTISYRFKMFRDGECYRCDQIMKDEYQHEITLLAGASVEGDCSIETVRNQALHIHDNYIKHVPGMANTRLTDFELVDVTVK
ncbi:MAG: hypothetical protein ACI837_000021 [Crocinitomicaceae bacterium]|jgi:hypothetical protein